VKGDRADENDLESVARRSRTTTRSCFARAVLGALPKGPQGCSERHRRVPEGAAGLWAGDQPEEYIGFQRAIVAAQTAAMSGFPTGDRMSAATQRPGVTAELFQRWAQFSAVSPCSSRGIATTRPRGRLGSDAMNGSGTRPSCLRALSYLYGLLQAPAGSAALAYGSRRWQFVEARRSRRSSALTYSLLP